MEKDNEEKTIENLRKNKGVSFAEADIILNLIDKQQKEIKKLKEENAEQREVITEWVNGERINDIKHISKEKIKNVLDEHFRFYKELRKQDNYPNEAIVNSDCLSRLSMLQTLYLELLEE